MFAQSKLFKKTTVIVSDVSNFAHKMVLTTRWSYYTMVLIIARITLTNRSKF